MYSCVHRHYTLGGRMECQRSGCGPNLRGFGRGEQVFIMFLISGIFVCLWAVLCMKKLTISRLLNP